MRVAVFGAGYAGLTVARRLERELPDDVELVVVDESRSHLVQHELHRVVRRPDLAETITVPLADVLERATVRRARVVDVDLEARTATLEPVDDAVDGWNRAGGDDGWDRAGGDDGWDRAGGDDGWDRAGGDDGDGHGNRDGNGIDDETGEGGRETLGYDVAAICLGAETAFYDLPGVEANALPLKRLEHARAIRREVLAAAGGTLLVGGGGLSGVQIAGELAELSVEEGLDLDVRLVERLDRVAPGFDAAFSDALRTELEARDVAVETGVGVERADDGAVTLEDGRSLAYDVLVWTGGIRGPSALDGERLPARADLRVAESTYVVGDAGRVVDHRGEATPASAQTAIHQAQVAAENVLDAVAEASRSGTHDAGQSESDRPAWVGLDRDPGRGPHRYRYEPLGWTVSVGNGAVARVGPVVLSGEPARAAKAVVGAGHLSSVGAIERASELVAVELGWPTDETAARVLENSDLLPDGALENPATSFGFNALALAEAFAPGGAVDLTAITRLTDRDHPGSPANRLERSLTDSVRSLRHGPDDAGSDETAGDRPDPGASTRGDDRADDDRADDDRANDDRADDESDDTTDTDA